MFSFELPPDLPEDKMSELIEGVTEGARKIGLYTTGVGFLVDERDEEEHPEKEHKLLMSFRIGDVAFSPRIQDPEQDEFNDQFRRIAASSVDDEVEDIRRRYSKEQETDGNEEAGTD